MEQSHYYRLAKALNNPESPGIPVQVTIEQLSELLCCTPRNVKFILRKLEDQELIAWKPGRGRGHLSSLTFFRSTDDMVEENFRDLLNKGKIKEVIELIRTSAAGNLLRDRLMTELTRHMGFRSDPASSSGKDVLRMMRGRVLERLDPAFVFTAFEAYIIGQVCSTLVVYNAAEDRFSPGLSHTWEHNADYTVWTFYLRKGVRFHHDGQLTAKDVKYTLERLLQLDSPSLWQFRELKEVRTSGDYTVSFCLEKPNRFFLHTAACLYMSILPHDVGLSEIPVGTGPFRVSEMNEDVLVLTAFDSYYGIRPLLDRVEIWFFLEHAGSDRRYEVAGEESPVQELMSWNQYNSSIDYPALGCRYIMINFGREGVHHRIEVRQALRHLYDREAIIRELGGSRYKPADSLLPQISRERDIPEGSLQTAKELLMQAEYAGEPVTFAFTTKKEEMEEAEWLHARARSIGLNLVLVPLSSRDSRMDMVDADLLLAEEVLEDDWEWGMLNFYQNDQKSLRQMLHPAAKEALNQALENVFQLKTYERFNRIREAESLVRDNLWMLYTCHLNKKAKLSDSLLGRHTGSFGFLDISRLWVKNTGAKET
ncbi:HTH-type transcriptional regulator SgrR [compost metagenome]